VETKANVVGIVIGTVAGLLIGAGGGYMFATKTYNDQVAALAQSANAKLAAANEQIQKSNEQQQALAMPDLPTRVSFRPALIGSGLVAQIQNFGATELVIAATAKSAATNQQKSWRLVIAPGKSANIGHMEGWSFADGDELELVESGYRPLKFHVAR